MKSPNDVADELVENDATVDADVNDVTNVTLVGATLVTPKSGVG